MNTQPDMALDSVLADVDSRDAAFIFLARDTARAAPKSDEGGRDIDNRPPALHSLGGGGREYKAVYVQSDAEIGLFSDEVVVNCAP